MRELVFWDVDDYNTDLEFNEVLLEFEAAAYGGEHVKFLLRDCKKRSVFERIPTFLVNRGRFVLAQQQLHARIYALVSEDAHSRIWLLAKSSTVRTCCRVTLGYSFRNWSMVSPPSRKSIRLCTGTRVPRKQGVPLRRCGLTHIASSNRLFC